MRVWPRSIRLIMCMVIGALLAGCSGGADSADVGSASRTGAEEVADAGDGQTQSAPELGTQSRPVPIDLVAAHPQGVLAMPSVDLCAQPGVTAALQRFNSRGIEALRAELWFSRPGAEPARRTLVCSIPSAPIHPQSGAANMSVPCPYDQPYADRSTGAVRFRYARGTGFTTEVTQVAGGYGSGGDGLWGYDFTIKGTEVLRPVLWLLCNATPQKPDQP